jgi:hypothetical protein
MFGNRDGIGFPGPFRFHQLLTAGPSAKNRLPFRSVMPCDVGLPDLDAVVNQSLKQVGVNADRTRSLCQGSRRPFVDKT